MKPWLWLAAALCASSAVPAQAAQSQSYKLEVAPELYYYDYDEPGVMEQDGLFYGVKVGLEYRDKYFMRADVRGAYGLLDYSSPVSGTMDDIDDLAFETRFLGGYDVPAGQAVTVTPFVGLGYRYLSDDTAGRTTSTGALGFERESHYIYSPIGLRAEAAGAEGWSLRAEGEYDLFWKGQQESHLSDAIAGLADLENDQDDGYGLRASLAAEHEGARTNLVIEGFIRYWDIEDSDLRPINYLGTTIGLGYEPANETIEVGGSIGVKF